MSPPRMRTPVTAMTSTPPMSMPAHMRLPCNIRLPSLLPPTPTTIHKRQQARKSKENTIHNPKRKTSLQHRTLFICCEMKGIDRYGAEDTRDLVLGVGGDVCAVLTRDAAQFVDASDEGADEAEVDEGYEQRVVFGAVVGEEGADCPGRSEDGDDEEDEDVVWCEGVGG